MTLAVVINGVLFTSRRINTSITMDIGGMDGMREEKKERVVEH